MSAIDCWLGAAYRLYVLEGAQAQAVSGLRSLFGADANLMASAQTKLHSITDDMKERDYISKVNASILSAALAQ